MPDSPLKSSKKLYYKFPFPFDKMIDGKKESSQKESIDQSIHSNIRFLILTRSGFFAFDPELGFELWEYDKRVLDSMKNTKAHEVFNEKLKKLIKDNEVRLKSLEAKFEFIEIENMSVHQHVAQITVTGERRDTGADMTPFEMHILYSPFEIKRGLYKPMSNT